MRDTGLKIVIKFMLHSPDLEPVLAMQDTMLKTLIAVARGKGTESQVRRRLLLLLYSIFVTRCCKEKGKYVHECLVATVSRESYDAAVKRFASLTDARSNLGDLDLLRTDAKYFPDLYEIQ